MSLCHLNIFLWMMHLVMNDELMVSLACLMVDSYTVVMWIGCLFSCCDLLLNLSCLCGIGIYLAVVICCLCTVTYVEWVFVWLFWSVTCWNKYLPVAKRSLLELCGPVVFVAYVYRRCHTCSLGSRPCLITTCIEMIFVSCLFRYLRNIGCWNL